MSLEAGTKLGPYEILAPIGAGGMGEVCRARDTKLERDVAIKVLPAALAQDPERLARFDREAKVLASLNHPSVAQIYGIEDRALVMELVEGHTLQGPLSIETALNYARQIADALEAAHEKNIIHRDLKPANILVRRAQRCAAGSPATIRNKVHARCFSWVGYKPYSEWQSGTQPRFANHGSRLAIRLTKTAPPVRRQNPQE
ncbi:MAG: protein kinase [Bryobacteraceae bacterium]